METVLTPMLIDLSGLSCPAVLSWSDCSPGHGPFYLPHMLLPDSGIHYYLRSVLSNTSQQVTIQWISPAGQSSRVAQASVGAYGYAFTVGEPVVGYLLVIGTEVCEPYASTLCSVMSAATVQTKVIRLMNVNHELISYCTRFTISGSQGHQLVGVTTEDPVPGREQIWTVALEIGWGSTGVELTIGGRSELHFGPDPDTFTRFFRANINN